MRKVCSVPFCSTKKSDIISMHSFPNDYSVRHKWLNNIVNGTGVTHYNIGEYSSVCGKHFEKRCHLKAERGRNMLKKGSVPTIFEQPTDGETWPKTFYHKSIHKSTDWVFSEEPENTTRFRCVTCFANCDECRFLVSDKIFQSGTSIKDMIILLVPQMKRILGKTDYICSKCHKVLACCSKFRTSCLQMNKMAYQLDPHTNEIYRTSSLDHEAINAEDNFSVTIRTFQDDSTEDNYNEGIPLSKSISLPNEESSSAPKDSINSEHNYFALDGRWNVQSSPEMFDGVLDESGNVSLTQTGIPDDEHPEMNLDQIQDVCDENNQTEDHIDKDSLIENTSKSTQEIKDSIMVDCNLDVENVAEKWDIHAIPETPNEILAFSRIVSFTQPNDAESKEFVNMLASNGVDVYQSVSDAPPSAVAKPKRILLLGGLLCKLCGEYFSGTSAYEAHSIYHSKQRKRKYRRITRNSQQEVGEADSKIDDFKCGSCLITLDTQEELEYHRRIHPQFVCEICGKRSSTSQGLHVHQITHKAKDLICEKCGRSFKSPMHLSNHLNRHKRGDFTCHKCTKVFNSRVRLRQHLKTKHRVNTTEELKCEECDKSFKSRRGYKMHNRAVHHKNAILTCGTCDQEFLKPENLKKHRVKNYCGTKNIRSTRIRKHLGPYKCQKCPKVFPEYERLKVHMRMHNRLFRYPCKFCNRHFNCKSRKDKHEKIHEKSMNHKCAFCSECFESRKELDEHMSKHDENIYKCERCEEVFENEHLLIQHVMTHHSKNGDAIETMRECLNEEGLMN